MRQSRPDALPRLQPKLNVRANNFILDLIVTLKQRLVSVSVHYTLHFLQVLHNVARIFLLITPPARVWPDMAPTPPRPRPHVYDLPNECLELIISHCDLYTACNVRLTS
jgi:hypothetical protein